MFVSDRSSARADLGVRRGCGGSQVLRLLQTGGRVRGKVATRHRECERKAATKRHGFFRPRDEDGIRAAMAYVSAGV